MMKGYSIGMMGGYSLVAISVVGVFVPEQWIFPLTVTMMVLANFMNHPHFISSYKIFFEGFESVRRREFATEYLLRWWFAAVGVPFGLIVLLSIGVRRVMAGDASIFAFGVLIYLTTVGWHYVKQGFGMAMSEAALKKCYWSPPARKWMLFNAYACWFATTAILFSSEKGLSYFGFYYPLELGWLRTAVPFLAGLFLATTLGAVIQIKRNVDQWRREGKEFGAWPTAGLTGYFVSLYAWIVASAVNPILMLVIPFFHSLQYMHVVSRLYAQEEAPPNKGKKLSRWFSMIFIGFAAFWLIPGVIDYWMTGKINIVSQSGMLYTGAAWLFINVHHYFIDNVIWRRESKYVWARLQAH